MSPRRALFVFHWLVVGGEETEVRLLARHLRPDWGVDVVVCHRRPDMPQQTHRQLRELGVPVDMAPSEMPEEQAVEYLAGVIPGYDVVVACQGVPHVHHAMRRLARRPPLIEHGGLVREALTGPKDLTDRYVGVCASIRDAAAGRMRGREHDALEIPSMVDLRDFDLAQRAGVRTEWGLPDDVPVVGWVGRLDRKKRVEDVLAAAALLAERRPQVRWVVVGGPNFQYPEHERALHDLADRLRLRSRVRFLGDRDDVPRLLTGMDVLVWLSEGEGMPHVIAEAGAACLPVLATRDNGAEQQIDDGVSGLFVPGRDPGRVADALTALVDDPGLRQSLGSRLRQAVEQRFSVDVVIREWRTLLEDAVAAGPRGEPSASGERLEAAATIGR